MEDEMDNIPVTVNQQIGDIDLMILKMIDKRATVREIGKVIGRAPSAVQAYLVKLEGVGLVTPPTAPRAHRARSITGTAGMLLNANLGPLIK
jgi:predicted transcriptional regulator